MRRFNTKRPKDDPWSKRRVQKYLYHNHLGSDIDPGQLVAQPGQAPISDLPLHFNNEMYLLGLSSLVPLDLLLKRLKRVTAPLNRWDASNDAVVSEFLKKCEEDSDAENELPEMINPVMPDSSISNSKSMSRGKNEMQEEDPSIIVMNETHINDQPEEN